jgi:hypothetical protein
MGAFVFVFAVPQEEPMSNLSRALVASVLVTLTAAACTPAGPPAEPQTHAFTMSDPDLDLLWAITRDDEMPCGGDEVGGGAIAGTATFVELGVLELVYSAAWDIEARIADPDQAEFEPQGPAGGPFAPVMGPDEHPYHFQYDPFTGECAADAPVVSATGEVEFTAADGGRIFAQVTGGETHRLDFVLEGDGIETFAIAEFTGGTGRFANATGSFVVHTIARFDLTTLSFVVDLVEILDGGSITY